MPHKVLQRTYSTRLQRLRARVVADNYAPFYSPRSSAPTATRPSCSTACSTTRATSTSKSAALSSTAPPSELACSRSRWPRPACRRAPGTEHAVPSPPFSDPAQPPPRGFPAPTPGGAVAPPGHQGDLFWPVRRARSSAPREGLRALADSAVPGPGDPSAAPRRHSRRRSATPPSRPRLLGRRRSWGDAARRDLDGPPRGR